MPSGWPGPPRPWQGRGRFITAGMTILVGLVVAIGVVVVAALPASSIEDDETTMPVHDAQRRAVVLPAPARRVVTLAPHATELVFAAGGGDRLVGAVRYSDWPPAARQVPRVGDAWQLNAETLVSLRPDLLVAWLPGPVQPLQPALDAAGIATFYSAPARLGDIADDIEGLGVLMDTRSQAAANAQALRQRVLRLEQTFMGRTPVRVFVHAGSEPLYTLSDAHVVGDALRVCGARNVFGATLAAAPQIGLEALVHADPQVILTTQDADGSDPLAFWQAFAPNLPAVRAKRVVVLDADALYRPGPRLIDATEQLCNALQAVRLASP